MRRLKAAVINDIRFQFKHGFYYAYLFVSIVYILGLMGLKGEIKNSVATLILLTDTSILGFFFIGGIVLMEKEQNILESLFVSPLLLKEYLIAKVLSLTILSILSSLLIIIVTFGIKPEILIFIPGLILSASFFTLFGIFVVAKAKNVNDYFLKALKIGMFISAPIVDYLGLFVSPLFYLFPTKASIILIDVLFHKHSTIEILYAFICLIVWIIPVAALSYKKFYDHVVLHVGDGK